MKAIIEKPRETVLSIDPIEAAKWRAFFQREATTNVAAVDFSKWCDCGTGRDVKTGLPRFFSVFYFNDDNIAGWACLLCKHPASNDNNSL